MSHGHISIFYLEQNNLLYDLMIMIQLAYGTSVVLPRCLYRVSDFSSLLGSVKGPFPIENRHIFPGPYLKVPKM